MEDPEQLLRVFGSSAQELFSWPPRADLGRHKVAEEVRLLERCGRNAGHGRVGGSVGTTGSGSVGVGFGVRTGGSGSGSGSVVVCPREHGLDEVPPRFWMPQAAGRLGSGCVRRPAGGRPGRAGDLVGAVLL